jgi:hypothetical protein
VVRQRDDATTCVTTAVRASLLPTGMIVAARREIPETDSRGRADLDPSDSKKVLAARDSTAPGRRK